jgi:hypothetical protein
MGMGYCEGKQSASLVIKITNPVIASGFTLALISLASLAVQMLDLGQSIPALFWRQDHLVSGARLHR